MSETLTPAFRQRPSLTPAGGDGASPPRPAGPSRAPLAFWATLLIYAALRQTGIHIPIHIVVPTILVLLVVLAVKADRSRGRPLAERYLAVWPYAWRGVWVIIAIHCVLLALLVPLFLILLLWVSPAGTEAVVAMMFKIAAFFLALAALSTWLAFRGHRAAYAAADLGAKAASSGLGAVSRVLARSPLGRWRGRGPFG